MSDYTSKLNLYKVDPAIDGEHTFNIKSMMNDNWDKIDEKVGNMNEKLSGVEDNANNYNHPATHNADMIRIKDEGGKFTGDNVEDALEEVGSQLADIANYKSDTDEYQTPVIVGTQIQLQRQSDTKRLFFKLSADLTGGDITISLDGGTTSKNLKDIENVNVTELSKGFVEVVEESSFFTYAPKNGGFKLLTGTAPLTVSPSKTVLKGQLCEKLDTKDTYGTATHMIVYSTASHADPGVAAVDKDRALVAYKKDSVGVVLRTINTINSSMSSEYTLSSAPEVNINSLWSLGGNKVLIVLNYNYNTTSFNRTVLHVVTVADNDTISFGSEASIARYNNANFRRFCAQRLTDNKVILTYQYSDTSGNRSGVSALADISGNSITVRTRYTFHTSYVGSGVFCHALSDTKMFFKYNYEAFIGYYNISTNVITYISPKLSLGNSATRDVGISPTKVGTFVYSNNYYDYRLIKINGDSLSLVSGGDERFNLAGGYAGMLDATVMFVFANNYYQGIDVSGDGMVTEKIPTLQVSSNTIYYNRIAKMDENTFATFYFNATAKRYYFTKVVRRTNNEIRPSSANVNAIPLKDANAGEEVNAYVW
ncbi:hypothetical protein [Vallitalea sp.]|jgi:hypothetical protein|uniref:hypothetical protein n=1 Tax=Vallitalea sp. TaxID=1882829 RepID=UPI0025E974F8|nr:hypothetical protein [Vallitalea sp.]MCT4686347.1 hypothetical protein [Vallitalea sp.]